MSLPRMIWKLRGRVSSSLYGNGGVGAAALIRPFSMENKRGGAAGKPDMALIRELREASGAPIVDCKNALAVRMVGD